MGVLIDPEYIQFLLDPDLEFSCYFVVGNSGLAPVEKIGVVRKMLAAHSEVFRAQLLDRRWKSEEPEHINDIFPETFRNLLRFVYGFDTTATMSFDDADDMLYVADRYIMPKLKDKLATRLTHLLDYTNICSLLTNPACTRALELQKEISLVLQYQTDKILAHPQFLSCCLDTFVTILKEAALNVSETDLWRAAIKWAKNRAKSEDPNRIQQELKKPLEYIRMRELPIEDLICDIAEHRIFSLSELPNFGPAIEFLVEPSLTLVPRTKTISCSKQSGVWYKESEEVMADVRGIGWVGVRSRELSFTLQTLELPITILTLVCFVYNEGEYNFTAMIERLGSSECTVAYSTHSTGGYANLHLAMSTCEREVVLWANTRYKVTISCDRDYYVYSQRSRVDRREHFQLEFHGDWSPGSPVAHIRYKTLSLR